MRTIESMRALIEETIRIHARQAKRRHGAFTKEFLLDVYARTEKFHEYLLKEDGSPDKELFDSLQRSTVDDCEPFLLERVFEFARYGLVDEAVTIGRWFAEVSSQPENFLGDVGRVLAEAGRTDEALKQIEENLRRFPDDVWVVINAGDALFSLGDITGAEKHFLAAEKMATGPYERLGALERLVELSLTLGDTLKADEYEKEFCALSESDWSTLEDVPQSPSYETVVKGKKIGRNEPCPCGSGKKYKKCCGR